MNIDRVSVMVVDQGSFSRALMVRVLRGLGLRQVHTATDGSEAIKLIQLAAQAPQKVGVQSFDIIFCEWDMTPINGGLFLKWVRRHKDSPNKFASVVITGAAVEPAHVAEARDLGASEFMLKPFSIGSLSSKVLHCIERQRNFIYTSTFFGPDRRRNQHPISFKNRRVATKENVEIIHGGKIPSSFKEHITAYYIRPPKNLKDLVMAGGFKKDGAADEPMKFDPALLQAAQSEITALESDYSDWVAESIAKLNKCYNALQTTPENHGKIYQSMSRIAVDLKGQGETFGYPLVTELGKSLYDYSKMNIKPDESYLELLKSHIDAIGVVVREKIKGDGGDVGHAIMEGLKVAVRKYEDRAAK